MFRLQGLLRNWTNLVTVIGCILVVAIIFSSANSMLVLVVLGAMNVAYGIYSIVKAEAVFKGSAVLPDETLVAPKAYHRRMGVCQFILGAFLLIMGVVSLTNVGVTQEFWNVLLVGIVVLFVLWNTMKRMAKRKY